MLFVKYIDDDIQDLEVDESQFEDITIPVILVKNTDGAYLWDVITSEGKDNQLIVKLVHNSIIDQSLKKI